MVMKVCKLQVIIMSRNSATNRAPFLSVHSNPIYIEDQNAKTQGKYINAIATIGRLPQFQSDDKITNLLYSKFIVKGVKPIKQQAIMTKLRKSNSLHNNRKVTRQTTNYTKDVIVKQAGHKHLKDAEQSCNKSQDKIFDFAIQNSWKKSIYVGTYKNNDQDQKYTFQRSMSAKSIRRPQTAIKKSSSAKVIIRPQSAVQGQNVREQIRRIRPQTAKSKSSNQKQVISKYYEYQDTETKPNILTISQFNPLSITVDYIQKNKRELSSKKKSLYLTTPETTKVKTNQKLLQNKSKQFDTLLVRKKSNLTQKQREMIGFRQRQYLNYMKVNMPEQYRDCMSFLSKMSQSYKQQEHSLLSMGIGQDQPLTITSKQIERYQIQQFYQNFLNQCIDTQYALKKTQRKKEVETKTQGIINIQECKKLLHLFQNLKKLRNNCKSFDYENTQIKKIVKNLSFYKNLRPEMLKKVFEMEYQIVQIQQNTLAIQKDSQIKSIYVIINGSVTKKNEKVLQDQQQQLLVKIQPPQFHNTLFDGEVFGFPNKVTDKLLHYSIKTAERCLFMVFPYQSYRSALRSNQSLQDQINILKQIFPNASNKFQLNDQDYESLAFQMQTRNYSAQEIVVRQGQKFQNLVIVANGCINVCFESVIRRNKQNSNYLKKKRKYEQKKSINVADLRKTNLFSYELLCEDQQEMQYYYCQNVEQKIRGDVINWRGFQHALANEFSILEQYKLGYSLMSAQDITKVYILAVQHFEALSENLKTLIKSKLQKNCHRQKIVRDQATLNKWQNYKIKICQEILRSKQTKNY